MKLLLAALAIFAVVGVNAFGPRCPPGKYTIQGELKNAMIETPRNFKVAFLGDQGLNPQSKAVLNMVKNKGSQLVIHSGDFDYESDPEAWMSQLENILGDDFPYIASIGNHDNLQWDNYQRLLINHINRANISCVGDVGVQATCEYQGFVTVLSGVGTRRGELDPAEYFAEALSARENLWATISWHKNHRDMQIGGKVTEVGIEYYDAAMEQGVILATGHEHSYCRSHLMSSYSDYIVADTNNTLNIEPGKNFVFVSGLGGQSIRDWNDRLIANPWWAAYAASDNDVAEGALFCTFYIENNPRLAECTFEDINGRVWDTFRILNKFDAKNEQQNKIRTARLQSKRNRLHQVQEEAIMSVEDDFTVDATGKTIQGEQFFLGTGYTTTLRFRSFAVSRNKLNRMQSLHLQMYGASNGEMPSFEIRAVVHGDMLTESVVFWDQEEDEFTNESLWVSPDLLPLAKEVLAKRDARMIQGLSLVITGKGFRKVWATEKNVCLAPTLSMVFKEPTL